MPKSTKLHELIGILTHILEKDVDSDIRHLIAPLSPPELARMIESLPSPLRIPLWQQVALKKMAKVLLEAHGSSRRNLIQHTEPEQLLACLSVVQMDELADLDDDLPISVVNAMVAAMDEQRKKRYTLVKDYPDDTAGGLMDLDATAIRADVTLKAVLRFLRRLRRRDGALAEHLDSLMVVDRANRLRGFLPLSTLISSPPDAKVADVMIEAVISFTPLQAAKDVARIFTDKDLLSAPVIDEENYLLGRITVDDIIDVLREESDRELLGRAGLDPNEDMFAPIMRSSLRRAFWLGINLLTAFLAAGVIGMFGATIEEIVALAVLMPVVASMGGIAGSQTLTLVTRAIALDQIGQSNFWRLLRHELGIGLLNGVFWALIVAAIAYWWFADWMLGLVFGMALLVAMLTGALAGAVIPISLKRIGIDPALAGGVVLTTATDVVGFMALLGLGTIILL
ncbi:MAG: magnesium transporter [Motiliproteus sp.]|jgi:magnesium transporter